MALELRFNAKESFDQVSRVISEFTGQYNATTNLGGYGNPNPTVGSLTYAEIKIQMRGETTVYTIPVTSGLPSDNTNPPDTFAIPYTSFGGRRDGIFHLTYSVGTSSSNIVASNDYYFAFIGKIQCGLRKIRQGLKLPNGCHCRDEKVTSVMECWSLSEALCDLTGCDDLDGVQDLIDFLTKFVQCNCKTC